MSHSTSVELSHSLSAGLTRVGTWVGTSGASCASSTYARITCSTSARRHGQRRAHCTCFTLQPSQSDPSSRLRDHPHLGIILGVACRATQLLDHSHTQGESHMMSNQAHAALVAAVAPKHAAAPVERKSYTRADLASRSARAKLPARGAGNKPFFCALTDTVSLGYQQSARVGQAGKWIKREYKGKTNGQHKYQNVVIGAADDIEGAGLTIDDAAKLAANVVIAPVGSIRVRDAIAQYRHFKGKRGKKSDKNMARDFNQLRYHVLGVETDRASGKERARKDFDTTLADTKVVALTTEQLEAWRAKLALGDTSIRRVWSALHSALEQAARKPSNGISSNAAWRKCAQLSQEHNAREVHFTNPQAIDIIVKVRAI